MQKTTYLIAAILVGVGIPVVSAVDTSGCWVRTSADANALGSFYVKGTLGEIWEETNGVDGLQRRDSGCSDGRVIASDTCYYMGADGLSRCSAETASSQL